MNKNFIDKQVLYTQTLYDERLRRIKKNFIIDLSKMAALEEFKKVCAGELLIDHSFMEDIINILEMQIIAQDHLTMMDFKKQLPNKYELVPISEFQKYEAEYYKRVTKYYEKRLETIKDIPDKEAYLTKQIKNFDNIEKFITYYHHGMPWSRQKLSTYNSMLFNVNLTRSGWNQTYKDSILLDKDLMLLATHPNSCPVCAEHQGKIYSIHGTTPGYKTIDEAMAEGVGHPNCKCEWVLFYDDEVEVVPNPEGYEQDQKEKAIERLTKDYETDLELYSYIGNEQMVDKTIEKLQKLGSEQMI